jgi:hypothetical protein
MQSTNQVKALKLAANNKRIIGLLIGRDRMEINATPAMANVNSLPSAAQRKLG